MADNPKFFIPTSLKREIENRYGKEIAERAIKELQDKGTIETRIAGIGQGESDEIKNIASKVVVPFEQSKDVFQKLIAPDIDEATLTTPELEDRLEAFRAFESSGGLNRGRTEFDRDKFAATVRRGKPSYADYQIDDLYNRIRTGNVTENNPDGFKAALAREYKSGFFNKPVLDTASGNISRIEDLLRTRGEQESAEQQVTDFLAQAPEQSRMAREDFINSQIKKGRQFLEQEAVPSILTTLNARNPLLVRGGQAGAQVTEEAAKITKDIQSLASQLETEDAQFYLDIGYQKAVRELAKSTQDVRSNLQFQKQTEAINREQNFSSREAELDAKLRENLLERNLKTQLASQRRQLQRDQDLRESAARGDIGSQAGAVAGQIGTALLLKKFGAF